MALSIDNGLSRYAAAAVTAALLICCSGAATAGVDDVWAASPATQDTQWAQVNAAPVSPSNSGNSDIDQWQWIVGSRIGTNNYKKTIWVNVSNVRNVRVNVNGGQAMCVHSNPNDNHTNTCMLPVPVGGTWEVSTLNGIQLYVPVR